MTEDRRTIALIDDLRAQPAGQPWFEFKQNQADPEHPRAGYVPFWA